MLLLEPKIRKDFDGSIASSNLSRTVTEPLSVISPDWTSFEVARLCANAISLPN